MCGLVGLIHFTNNGFNSKDVDTFEQMLYVNTLRGDDATGVACVNTKQGAKVFKEAISGSFFTYDADYTKARSSFIQEGKALLGHNRKATVGGKKDEHAHPFVFDDRYVFFHNGTINNHRKLADTEVDSEALGLKLTALNGDVDAIASLLEQVNGAYACVWYDAEKHHVYFLRNLERPLSFIKFENGGIAYSSEPWIAIGPATRNYYKVKEVVALTPHTLYSIDLSTITPVLKEEALPKKAIPSMTNTSVVIGGTNFVGGKKKGKHFLSKLRQSSYVGFWVDEAICTTINPQNAQCYDWLITGCHEDFPGVVFKWLAKDLFQYEAEDLEGRYVSAIYDNHSITNGGTMDVWVKSVFWKKSNAGAH